VITGWRDEHLRLVLQPAKGLRVDDSVAVALKLGPHVRGKLARDASATVGAAHGRSRKRVFARFESLAD
jgi:hypothetical protein